MLANYGNLTIEEVKEFIEIKKEIRNYLANTNGNDAGKSCVFDRFSYQMERYMVLLEKLYGRL